MISIKRIQINLHWNDYSNPQQTNTQKFSKIASLSHYLLSILVLLTSKCLRSQILNRNNPEIMHQYRNCYLFNPLNTQCCFLCATNDEFDWVQKKIETWICWRFQLRSFVCAHFQVSSKWIKCVKLFSFAADIVNYSIVLLCKSMHIWDINKTKSQWNLQRWM